MSKAFLLWLSLLPLACFFSRSVKGASEGAAFNSCRSTTKLCVVRERCEVLDCQFTLDSPKQGKGPGFYILHENNTICSMVPGSKISKYAWILFQVSLSGHSDSDRETFVYECMRKDERSTRYLCDKRVAVYFLTLRQMPQLSIGEADERTGNRGSGVASTQKPSLSLPLFSSTTPSMRSTSSVSSERTLVCNLRAFREEEGNGNDGQPDLAAAAVAVRRLWMTADGIIVGSVQAVTAPSSSRSPFPRLNFSTSTRQRQERRFTCKAIVEVAKRVTLNLSSPLYVLSNETARVDKVIAASPFSCPILSPSFRSAINAHFKKVKRRLRQRQRERHRSRQLEVMLSDSAGSGVGRSTENGTGRGGRVKVGHQADAAVSTASTGVGGKRDDDGHNPGANDGGKLQNLAAVVLCSWCCTFFGFWWLRDVQ